MSLAPTNLAHWVLQVIVDATGNNSLICISQNFYRIDWELPRMGLQVLFAPYLLVVFPRSCIQLFI